MLDRLAPGAPAELHRRLLRGGGYLADPAGAGPAEQRFRAVGAALVQLDAAEEAVAQLGNPLPWFVGEVPPAVRWFVLAVAVVLALVGGATTGLGTVFALVGTPLVLTPLALFGLGWAAWTERRRRALLAAAEAERARRGAAVVGAAEALAGATCCLDRSGARLVSAPHLEWVRYRLRDLRVSRAPVETPERAALTAELQAELERMEAALLAPAVPEPAALEADVAAYAARVAALAVPVDRSGEGNRLSACLALR